MMNGASSPEVPWQGIVRSNVGLTWWKRCLGGTVTGMALALMIGIWAVPVLRATALNQFDYLIGKEAAQSYFDRHNSQKRLVVLLAAVLPGAALISLFWIWVTETQMWREVDEKAFRNVVTICFSRPMPFDGTEAGSYKATGFVVDAKRGYILTNRHVVGDGPFRGSCIFSNNEEIPCWELYRDPVHDFALLAYKPQDIKHQQVDGLQIKPGKARVGLEIRVFGNNASNSLSIVQGIISSIHRNAPKYGGPYRDINTYYILANINLTSGSSGSPAIAVNGAVVGMMCSGGESHINLLPLDGALRALECLQNGNPAARGDIQCIFKLTPFNKCRSQGLDGDWEAKSRDRFAAATGLLRVKSVIASGPASGKMKVGDILLEVNGMPTVEFSYLERIFDANIGTAVKILVHRDGGTLAVEVMVVDLHQLTPDCLVVLGGHACYLHNPSYARTVAHGKTIEGVFVADSGGQFTIGDGGPDWIIQWVGGRKVRNLGDLLQVLQQQKLGARVVFTSVHLDYLFDRRTNVLTVDTPGGFSVAFPSEGAWKTVTENFLPSAPPIRQTGVFTLCNADVIAESVARSLIHVESRGYACLDGRSQFESEGMGVVVDVEMGLVVASRHIVPHRACTITLTIGASVSVDGICVFWHPHHNYVVIQYKPALVDVPVLRAELSGQRVSEGEEVTVVGFTCPSRIVQGNVRSSKAKVAVVDPISPLESSLRYYPMNADLVGLAGEPAEEYHSGVVVNAERAVVAIWLPFDGPDGHCRGIRTPSILDVVSALRAGLEPKLRILPAEIEQISLNRAKVLGVGDDFIRQFGEAGSRCAFQVKRAAHGLGMGSEGLHQGDIFISLNGKVCTEMADFGIAYTSEKLQAVIFRQGLNTTLSISIDTVPADNYETDRYVFIWGAYVQPPHLPVRLSAGDIPSEVYVSWVLPGSPAAHSKLESGCFITEVDGEPVTTLDSFTSALKARGSIVTEPRNVDPQVVEGFSEVQLFLKDLAGFDRKIGLRENGGYRPPVWCSLTQVNRE